MYAYSTLLLLPIRSFQPQHVAFMQPLLGHSSCMLLSLFTSMLCLPGRQFTPLGLGRCPGHVSDSMKSRSTAEHLTAWVNQTHLPSHRFTAGLLGSALSGGSLDCPSADDWTRSSQGHHLRSYRGWASRPSSWSKESWPRHDPGRFRIPKWHKQVPVSVSWTKELIR